MLIFSFLSLNPFPIFVTNMTFHTLYDLKLFGNGVSTFSDQRTLQRRGRNSRKKWKTMACLFLGNYPVMPKVLVKWSCGAKRLRATGGR